MEGSHLSRAPALFGWEVLALLEQAAVEGLVGRLDKHLNLCFQAGPRQEAR